MKLLPSAALLSCILASSCQNTPKQEPAVTSTEVPDITPLPGATTTDSTQHDSPIIKIEEEPYPAYVPPPSEKLSFSKGTLATEANWQNLEQGLDYAEILLPTISSIGNSKVSVLRIHPGKFRLELHSSKFANNRGRTAPEWMDSLGLVALVNAGMFSLGDYVTCTGYMKHYNQINNPNLNPSYNLIAAFNPKEKDVPLYRIIDRTCDDWELLKSKYHSYVQGIRIVDCHRKNRWSKQEKFWSMALLGEDQAGNLLFIFCRSPYRVHDLSKMLLQLPIQLARLMYLEGGPEASFCLNHPKKKVNQMGSYETDFNELDDNYEFWSIPNIISIKKI